MENNTKPQERTSDIDSATGHGLYVFLLLFLAQLITSAPGLNVEYFPFFELVLCHKAKTAKEKKKKSENSRKPINDSITIS
jgi:hypothetical protein